MQDQTPPETLPLDERVRRLELGHRSLLEEHRRHAARINRLEKTQTAVNRFLEIVPGLIQLQQHAERLGKLADVADEIVGMVKETATDRFFWKELRRRLSPLRPVGAVMWTLFLVLLAGAAAGWFYWFFAPGGKG